MELVALTIFFSFEEIFSNRQTFGQKPFSCRINDIQRKKGFWREFHEGFFCRVGDAACNFHAGNIIVGNNFKRFKFHVRSLKGGRRIAEGAGKKESNRQVQ
ncbi:MULTISPECIES: hypothetical protein [unclassified Akkermansia]|uniref:hypothetical protein n=1 Tax=unclassified Akkermansia TaxID=2608915 RepID=UPI0011C8984E|nr:MULTISPECIES: hypothetical protein [unclassified Akkermansia]